MNIILLSEVRAAILAEPQHVYMKSWVTTSDYAELSTPAHADLLSGNCHDTLCGTVGCIAGHTVAVGKRLKLFDVNNVTDVLDTATELISKDHSSELWNLFIPWNKAHYAPIIKEAETHTYGSRAYVQGVAKLIDKFVELNATTQERAQYNTLIG